jgi:hypothetical protein
VCECEREKQRKIERGELASMSGFE